MQWLRDLSLPRKMLTYISGIFLLLFFFGFFNINTMLTLQQELDSVEQSYLPNALVAKDMKQNIVQIQQWLTDISATRGLDGLDDGFVEAAQSYGHAMQNYQQFKSYYANNPERLAQLEAVKKALDDYYAQGKIMAQAYIDGGPKAGNQIMADFDAAAEKMDGLVTPFLEEQVAYANQVVAESNAAIHQLLAILIVVFIFITLVLVIGGVVITKLVVTPVKNLQKVMQEVNETGLFNTKVAVSGQDELGVMSKIFNQMLSNLHSAIHEANEVVSGVAQGRFDKRVTQDVHGDLLTLKQGVNGSADSVDFTMKELSKVMTALHNGDFSVRMDDRVESEFRNQVQTAMSSMNKTISEIILVMENMQLGRFQQRVDVEAHGDLLKLKTGINVSMDALEKAVKDIARVVVAQSHGELTHRITDDYHGELRVLKEAVNASSDKLVEVISSAISASNVVSSAAQEVSQGSLDLSERVQQQAAALEQTSATMDEMSSVVENNTENARQTVQETQQVQQKASEGVAVMRQTIAAMSAIQASSHQISEIVTLIDSIAFQTNLLALNAAVEAARAGDHGRGFAVVAGEVRALAQKSADAARDIRTLIEESVVRINDGTQRASESGEMLEGVNASINHITDRVTQIAQASGEQTEGIKQVHVAIAQIDSVTQQNAALVEETSAASEGLSAQAKGLQSNMAFFKTR